MAIFVLEIGTEELPARFLQNEQEELSRLFAEALDSANLAYGSMRVMATPRRLALIVEELAESQPESEIIVTGPPLHVARDGNGRPTRAMQGFAAANGVAIEDIFPHKTEKGEYVACRVKCGGRKAAEVLAGICPQIIEGLPFAKSMRWGSNTIFYARPLRWIAALLDDAVVPFAVGPAVAGRAIYGHRVHGPGPFELDHAANYEKLLAEKAHVVAEAAERKRIVRQGGDALARAAGGEILWKDSLLDEVSGLVEYPVPILGDFDPAYLEIPEEVLLTSMETHQKSFGLRGPDGRLLPHFLTALNLRPASMELVKNGWERVLKARLEDARFFWRADLADTFDVWLKKLGHVIFVGGLGSMGDKCRRLERLCRQLALDLAPAGLDPDQAARAGLLAKADLVSAMVGEFDTLQGIMGGIYAAKAGEQPAVAEALKEQYLPAGPDTPLPASAGGAILSLADKADTLAGCFGLNKIPTGAADPNGLRRCALGIIRILAARGWHVDLGVLLRQARELYGADIKWKLNVEETLGRLLEFFRLRLRNYFMQLGYDTVLVDAALAAGSRDPADVKARLEALAAFGRQENFLASAQTLKRIENMGRKADCESDIAWDDKLLSDPSEKALAAALAGLLPKLDRLLAQGDYAAALAVLDELRQPVNAFFDNVLVLCDEAGRRRNRLALLNAIRSRFARIAAFSAMQI